MKYTFPRLLIALLLIATLSGGCGNVPPNPNILSYEQPAEEIITSSTAVSPVKNEDFVGDWGVENGLYEQITVNDDGTYSTYLNERLFSEGTWKYVVGTLILDSEAFGKVMYVNVKKGVEKMILERDSGDTEIWQKIIL
jgi:hypothetical protein